MTLARMNLLQENLLEEKLLLHTALLALMISHLSTRSSLWCVSTRMLIVLALICGMAILVAFAVQAAQLI
ncbi:MAG: hypothetical protein F2694_03815 [Actinobacteria bacterium]|nr:hypothetical protein [Actinomycetota bacterium]